MPRREIVTVQIGQCGNQIGRRMWYELVHEAASLEKQCRYEASMSVFFRNVDSRSESELAVGSRLAALRARAVLIDMEEGVVAETLRDGLFGSLFDRTQLVTDVSGAGNNWAHGYGAYGVQYSEQVAEACRWSLERCESPAAFLMLQSVGGGTGSGLGSSVVEGLADAYPGICRVAVPVYPSVDDDVVTSPYNAVLATRALAESADCVVPLENDALGDACDRIRRTQRRGFDEMNDVAAQFLAHLTSTSRHGNVGLDSIARHVAKPRLRYITAGVAPILARANKRNASERADIDPSLLHDSAQRTFDEACSPRARLVRLRPKTTHFSHRPIGPRLATTLACSLVARGDVGNDGLQAAAKRLRPKVLNFPSDDALQLARCAAPPCVSCCRSLTLYLGSERRELSFASRTPPSKLVCSYSFDRHRAGLLCRCGLSGPDSSSFTTAAPWSTITRSTWTSPCSTRP